MCHARFRVSRSGFRSFLSASVPSFVLHFLQKKFPHIPGSDPRTLLTFVMPKRVCPVISASTTMTRIPNIASTSARSVIFTLKTMVLMKSREINEVKSTESFCKTHLLLRRSERTRYTNFTAELSMGTPYLETIFLGASEF